MPIARFDNDADDTTGTRNSAVVPSLDQEKLQRSSHARRMRTLRQLYTAMPYIALNSNNQEVTASDCRDEYLRTGVALSDFKCAFCLCTYYPRYIYVDGEIGRAPHFFVKADKHKGACDGTPLGVVEEQTSAKAGKRIPEQGFSFPEKLVPKARPRIMKTQPESGDTVLSDEEVRARRNRAGKEYGSKMFTSSLLEIIVLSKNKMIKWCSDERRKRRLDDAAYKGLLKDVANSYPLQLFEQKGLTYDSAFWNGKFERNDGNKRIFHAKKGRVAISGSGFIIRSETDVPLAPATSTKALVQRSVEVRYVGETYDSNTPPRAHTQVLQYLTNLAPNETIQWYAYGTMTREGEELVISLETLDHLYYRKEKQPI